MTRVNSYTLIVVFQAKATADRNSALNKAYTLYQEEMKKVVAVPRIGVKEAYSF